MTSAPTSSGFVHLHVHSEYSPLDSLAQVSDLVAYAAADGNPAIALTDHGTLGGIWKLGQEAQAAGIKAIPGQEFYLAIGSRHERNGIDVPDSDGVKSKRYEHLTVLAASRAGWRNLVALSNAAQESFWYKPRIDLELLAGHADGLIVLTGCLGGPIASTLARGDHDGAERALVGLCEAVGYDRVCVEAMDHGIPAQQAILPALRNLASAHGLPLVVTNDAHYLAPEQAPAHDAWLAVGTRTTVSDVDRFRFHGRGHHLRTEAEMRALHPEDWWQRACDATVQIADRVSIDVLPEPALRLPKYWQSGHRRSSIDVWQLVEGASSAVATEAMSAVAPEQPRPSSDILRDLVRQGAFERYGPDPERPGRLPREVNARLKFEFDVIDQMGLSDYFLITWDLIVWARSNRSLPTPEQPDGTPGGKKPIRVGPGRGSAAGSVVSYCLGIVNLDPIANGLLFERFLDPSRAGMPDIDTDFEQGRREEVLEYLQARYGRDRVARLGTYGMAATRAAIKDAARVLGLTPLGNRLTPLVPMADAKPATFADIDDAGNAAASAFRDAVKAAGDDGARLVALAREFEGVTKLEGIHACGTLIADEPMDDDVPLRHDRSKGVGPDAPRITTWDGKDVEDYGLLKLDVLGLRTLDVISRAVGFIEERKGESIDPDSLTPGCGSSRDSAAWELLSAGRTAAVFQLESEGITRLAQAVAPSSLADLTALVALYRPGPMGVGAHEKYAARKHGREPVSYEYLTLDPDEAAAIASVLGETYGLPVFQEQVMLLGSVVGGLDASARNLLRKAFSKKDASAMARVRGLMFDGGTAGRGTSGVRFDGETLGRLWELFEASASYLFNKSHAATYGLLTYQTAYLKANWPVEYAAAVLATTGGEAKRLAVLADLRREGIEVRHPCVNRSGMVTRPDGGAVQLGLGEAKGVGADAEGIVVERERGGDFASMADLVARVRVGGSALRINLVEALIEAGAFDMFGPRFGHLMVVRAIRDCPHLPVPDAEWGPLERAARERSRLGLTTGSGAIARLVPGIADAAQLVLRPDETVIANTREVPDGGRATLVGILTGWTQRSYSKGQMATVTLETDSESVTGVMWDDDLRRLRSAPTAGSVVLVRGRARMRAVETEVGGEDGMAKTETVVERNLVVREVVALDVDDEALIELPGPVLDWPDDSETFGQLVELPLGDVNEGSVRAPDRADVVVHRLAIGTIVHPEELLDIFDEVGSPPPCLYDPDGAVAVARIEAGIAVVAVGDATPVPTHAELEAVATAVKWTVVQAAPIRHNAAAA